MKIPKNKQTHKLKPINDSCPVVVSYTYCFCETSTCTSVFVRLDKLSLLSETLSVTPQCSRCFFFLNTFYHVVVSISRLSAVGSWCLQIFKHEMWMLFFEVSCVTVYLKARRFVVGYLPFLCVLGPAVCIRKVLRVCIELTTAGNTVWVGCVYAWLQWGSGF